MLFVPKQGEDGKRAQGTGPKKQHHDNNLLPRLGARGSPNAVLTK